MTSGSPDAGSATAWQVTGVSVRGESHARSGQPNQDALGWRPRSGRGHSVVLALSDGHGGAEYRRSELGARYAVRTALRILAREVLPEVEKRTSGGHADPRELKQMAEEWLPRLLVRGWRRAVLRHLRRYPTAAPLPVRSKDTEKEAAALRLYGATLIASLLTPWFHLYLQLGDGDVLAVGDDGSILHPPLPDDPALLGNETPSLCSPQAWRNVRVRFTPLHGEPPSLILLATDGYSNSFVDVASFQKVGSDLLLMIRRDGLASVVDALPGWLMQTSAQGSGDDISVLIATRAGALEA